MDAHQNSLPIETDRGREQRGKEFSNDLLNFLKGKGILNMNLVIKSAVAAALLSAVSISAFAATVNVTPPPAGPAPIPAVGNGGLMLEIFDTTSNHYDTLWLGGDLGTFTASATPAGGVTFDYGVVSNFSSLFSATDVSSGQVSFVVAASNTSVAGGNVLITTLSKSPANFTNAAIQNAATAIQTGVVLFDAASGCNSVNPCGATSTTDANYLGNQLNGRYNSGFPTTANAAGLVGGTGVGFYTLTQLQAGPGNGSKVQFANATGVGTWSVSATGDVTYTIPGASAVPLPAAIWLLGSGLVGLAGIGRRRLKAA
jgi:hypothetical protein